MGPERLGGAILLSEGGWREMLYMLYILYMLNILYMLSKGGWRLEMLYMLNMPFSFFSLTCFISSWWPDMCNE